ncbi:MAG: hypothetical protein HZA13_06665 [Nitrospirae bacterium]|nr:hypothetical protein [Nitrospirota bacterium]
MALSIKNDGIWSNDKHFEKIKGVKVWKTSDLFKVIEKNKNEIHAIPIAIRRKLRLFLPPRPSHGGKAPPL